MEQLVATSLIILILTIIYLTIKVSKLNNELHIILLALTQQINKNTTYNQKQYEYIATNSTIEPKQNIKNT
jgi:hypothetical protein